jgi:hypothetical protein
MLQNRPYLTVELEISGCLFDARVNGNRILWDFSGNQIKVELPVNQWMISGENNLSVNLYYLEDDPHGELAEMKATLKVRSSGTQSPKYDITSMAFDSKSKTAQSSIAGSFNSNMGFEASAAGDVSVGKITTSPPIEDVPGIVLSRTVSLPLNLPLWGFVHSEVISDRMPEEMNQKEIDAFYSEIKDELYPIYNQIQLALGAGNIEKILPMFEERNREIEQAFYYPKGKMAKDLASSLKESATDSKWTLLEMTPEVVTVDLSPNRRLIRLMNTDGSPAIIFNRTDGSMHEAYDIVFRRSGNNWIITR